MRPTDPPSPPPDAAGAEATAAWGASALLAPPQGPDEIGRLAHFRVLRLLGQGGMGIVYEAEDVRLRRRVALKVVRPDRAEREARARFLREAQQLASIRHDNIVTIYDVGEERGAPFLAMELLEGRSLESWLRQGARPGPAQVARIGRQVAEALAAAHARGLIHRDVKPANLWLEPVGGGRIKVLDFGLAVGTGDARITQAGTIVGTPRYMAPEQARGGAVDARADLFSLGCVLYEMCTGAHAFPGKEPLEVLSALANHEPAPPHVHRAEVPAALSGLVMQLLSKRPEGRPASAREVVSALAALEGEAKALRGAPLAIPVAQAVPAPPAAPVSQTLPLPAEATGRPAPAKKRPRRLWLVGAVVVLAVGLGLGLACWGKKRGPDKGGPPNAEKKDRKEREGPQGPAAVVIPPEALPFPAGAPLTRNALVLRPLELKGVRNWGLVTKAALGGYRDGAFCPTGKLVALAGVDGCVRLFDGGTGELKRVLVGHLGPATAVAFSPAEGVLASGGEDGEIRLWATASGRLLRKLSGQKGPVGALAWSPDGKQLASGERLRPSNNTSQNDFHVWFWSPATDEPGRRLSRPLNQVFQVGWSPNGRFLAAADQQRLVRLWDGSTGEYLRTVQRDREATRPFGWSPDGKRLAVLDRVVRLIDPDTGADGPAVVNGECHSGALFWSPDGRLLFAFKDEVALRDVEGKRRTILKESPLPFSWASWSRDGKVVLGGLAGALFEVGPQKARLVRPFYVDGTGGVSGLAWLPEGRLLVQSAGARALDGPSGKVLALPNWLAPASALMSPAPRGDLLAVTNGSALFLIDSVTGKTLSTVSAHKGTVRCLAWSPDGRAAATGGYDRFARLWHGPEGKPGRELEHDGPVFAVVFTPDGKELVTATHKAVWRWDVRTGKKLGQAPLEAEGRLHAEFSPTGAQIVLNRPAADGRARYGFVLCDTSTGKARRQFGSQPLPGRVVRWSPDGRKLAVGTEHGQLHLWDMAGPRLLATVPAHVGTVDGLAWSPDGRLVASHGIDRTVRVWDGATGQPRLTALMATAHQFLLIGPGGHFHTAQGGEDAYAAVVQTEDGQNTYSLAEFVRRFGFPNDPGRARLPR
jgi:WD40 repeat protein/tRNA A-37 threonylcarbamoyl transferase component Bud32